MIVIKGDQVEVVDASGNVFRCPDDFVLCHDPTGEYLNPCHFFATKHERVKIPDSLKDPEALRVAERYYGTKLKLADGRIALPSGGWQRVALIDVIRYRRRGTLKGLYEHKYESSIPFEECSGRKSWRLRHPDNCVADERGFVFP